MKETPKFTVFTIEQLKVAALEIAMRIHDYDESLDIMNEEDIYQILCKWTKEVPPKQPVWDSNRQKMRDIDELC